MKRMRLARAALVVGLAGAVGACDSLSGVNDNPNAPTDVGPGLLLPNSIRNGVEDAFGAGQYLTHTGPWSYQIVEIQYPDEEQGKVRAVRMDAYWQGFYAGELTDIQTVIDKGVESGDVNIEAAGRIWKAWLFHIVTDAWGDVPYSQALLGAENTTPEYDTQQQVYAGMLADLTTAADMLSSPDGSDFGSGDILYGNDFEAWRKFANSLRMRLAMRLSEVDATTALSEFVAAYNAGGFESNDDNAMLFWPGSPYENPIYENYTGRDDHGISAALVDTLTNLSDPRLPLYAEPAASDGLYRGHHNGNQFLPEGTSLRDFSRIGSLWRANGAATPTMVMSYSEVLFLQAEAAQRQWIGADAATLYAAAIRANMEQWQPFSSKAPTEAQITTYLAQPAVAYDGTLEQLITQKWISLYMAGPEAWSDSRRTDIPFKTPGPDLSISRIPVRFHYPDTEQSLNQGNLMAAVSSQGGGLDDLVTTVWWDVN